MTLRNSGTVAVDNPPMVMAAGKGDDPSGSIDVPALGTLQPGESRTYDIPFELGPLAFGSFTVRGAIPGLAEPLVFTGHTRTFPWALVLIPLAVLAQWLLLRGRNRLRDHLAPGEELPMATLALEAGAPASTEHVAPVEVPVDPVAEPVSAVASDPRGDPVVEPEAVPPEEPAPAIAAAASSLVDDPDHVVEVVTRETVEALLAAVGDRLLTRGEIWSLADAVSAEVGEETAAMTGMDEEAKRWLVRRLRTAVDEALVTRPLHEDDAPVPAGSR